MGWTADWRRSDSPRRMALSSPPLTRTASESGVGVTMPDIVRRDSASAWRANVSDNAPLPQLCQLRRVQSQHFLQHRVRLLPEVRRCLRVGKCCAGNMKRRADQIDWITGWIADRQAQLPRLGLGMREQVGVIPDR